jgi:hypothetical protein
MTRLIAQIKSEISDLKSQMNSVHSARRIACGFACLVCIVLSGCKPYTADVTVSIKPVAGASDATDTADAAAKPPEGYGNLVGTIVYEGDAPQLKPLVSMGDATVKDAAVCAAITVPDESLIVNGSNKGIQNAIIFLEKRPPFIKPELNDVPTQPVMFDQKNCQFLPHVLAFRAGQPLLVVSDDSIPHNTHTSPKRNDAFNKVIGANDRTGVPCDYKKAENTPVSVVCDYHPWMKAFHFPLDHPYFAVTDADGKFKIEGLPAGKHSFNVWHERASGGSQLLQRKLEITIEADKDNAAPALSFGGTKFAAIPRPAARRVAWSDLERGQVIVTQTEGK